jgi:hypothetical protein
MNSFGDSFIGLLNQGKIISIIKLKEGLQCGDISQKVGYW